MKTKLSVLFCSMLMLSFTFISCNDDDDDKDDPTPEIGVILKNPSNDWRKALSYYAKNELNNLPIAYTLTSAVNEEEQVKKIRAAVDQGCKVLVISPERINEEIINEVTAKDIPVVLMEEEVGKYTSIVYTNNKEIGAKAAEFMRNDEKIKKIAVFNVAQDPASSDDRIEGFKTSYENVPLNGEQVEFIDIEVGVYSKEDGKKATEELLKSEEYKDIDAIYAQDDEVAAGALEAIVEAENTTVKAIVGCGGSQEFFQLIKDTEGINLATTLYSPSMIAECVKIAYKLYKEESVEKEYKQIPKIVSKENVEEHLDENSPY